MAKNKVKSDLWDTLYYLLSFGLEYAWAAGYLTLPLLAWLLPAWSHLQVRHYLSAEDCTK